MTLPGQADLDPLLRPLGRTRRSLRIRLIGLVLAVATVALVVVDVVLPRIARQALLESRDQSLSAVLNALPELSPEFLQRLSLSSPLKTGVGWTVLYPLGRTDVVLPSADGDAGPTLRLGLETETALTLDGPDGTYRLLARQVYFGNTGQPALILAVWTNLEDVDQLVARLVIAELLVSAGLLVLLGAVASLLIRRDLRPLEEMAGVADSIAGGDLTRRVAVSDTGVEVNRLSVAFNGMLDGIDALLSERRAAEQRLRQFVADASHELRTPVAAVRGYTDLYAVGALPEDDAVARAMGRMGFEARRMGTLVEDLLTLVQADTPGAVVHEPVDLRELLRGVVDDAAAIDGTRSWLLSLPDGETATVAGDRNQLHQLFANLLGNVREHTPAGTTATVGVLRDADPRWVTVAVADDGPGVTAEQLPHLFDRFYRADPSRSRDNGGSGLGLAIVAALAGAHGGAVTASIGPTGGLVVGVRLPRVRASAAQL